MYYCYIKKLTIEKLTALVSLLGIVGWVGVSNVDAQQYQETEPIFEMKRVFEGRGSNIGVAMDGTVLAIQRGYLRRSENGGETWGEPIEIGPDAGDVQIVDETTGDVMVHSLQEDVAFTNGHMWRSQDHGKTWEEEEIIVLPNAEGYGSPDSKAPAYLISNEGGITLRHGDHKGRLIMPVYVLPGYVTGERWDYGDDFPYRYNTAWYSDDGGRTWEMGGPVQSGTGEGALAELSNGDIYYNSRSHMSVDIKRRIAWSYDGGETFWDWRADDELYDGGGYFRGYGMRAGLATLPLEMTDGNDVLLFTNPDTRGGDRRQMTVWASFDRGKTWPLKRLIYSGPSAYSSLAVGRAGTPSEGWIYVAFEGGEDYRYEGIYVARFNLTWLLGETLREMTWEEINDLPRALYDAYEHRKEQ